MGGKDPLQDLYADEEPYDKQNLSQVLEPYINIDPDSGEPVFSLEFESLEAEEKVILFLVYKRVAADLEEISGDKVPQSVVAISEETNVDEGEVDETIFTYNFIVEEDSSQDVLIPKHRVAPAIDYVS
ncbi:hypothetical protein RH831_11000 [Halodesulfurarchaeum sp. HSR-GB]|uniref:hypothetical protein n=1 Tax=Halodesulfurarchaeum sp. HSR-GB TaxID=3074077 RepID=UPI00285B18D1|nr:hypothetical protein [Halodesulfurarchaeum sp. HSR-GB]MDR5657703.1 hypothetical protein [Halodesulfurarchaeum sp. HSR-GB]